MMREAVKEFADKEIWIKKHEFEKHNYELTEKVMEKAGNLGFLGVKFQRNMEDLGMA